MPNENRRRRGNGEILSQGVVPKMRIHIKTTVLPSTLVIIVFITLLLLSSLLAHMESYNDGRGGDGGSDENDHLLLIVGHVSNSTARVLYEDLLSSYSSPTTVVLVAKLYEEVTTTTTTTGNSFTPIKVIHLVIEKKNINDHSKPQVIHFSNLKENTRYEVHFERQEQLEKNISTISLFQNYSATNGVQNSIVRFKTFCTSCDTPVKILVVSCNRFNEDGDDSMWNQMTQLDSDRHGMIHLGDQIYADEVVRNYNALLKNGKKLPSFEHLVEQFRQVYRRSFGHSTIQKVLRHGAHWMIPDDHDILNGLNRDQYMNKENNSTDISIVLKAGRQAFYEYQFQLYTDIYVNGSNSSNTIDPYMQSKTIETDGNMKTVQTRIASDEESMSPPPFSKLVEQDAIFFSMKMANVCWLVLDFRFQNTFQFDPNSRLIGRRQWEFIEQQLEECRKYARTTLVFSSIPMLVMSNLLTSTIFKISGERYTNHPDYLPDAVRLLNMFAEFKVSTNTDVRFIGGDVHQFFLSQICNGTICLDQMVASGVSKRSTQIKSLAGVIPFAINRHFQTVNVGPWKLYRNDNAHNSDMQQYLGRNYGRIVVRPSETDYNLFFQWHGAFNVPLSRREKVYQRLHDRLPTLLVATLVMSSLICTLLFQICWFKCSKYCLPKRGSLKYDQF